MKDFNELTHLSRDMNGVESNKNSSHIRKAAFMSPSRANLRTDVRPDSENMERAGHKPESDTVRAWSKFKTGMAKRKESKNQRKR